MTLTLQGPWRQWEGAAWASEERQGEIGSCSEGKMVQFGRLKGSERDGGDVTVTGPSILLLSVMCVISYHS